jgi:hypothetical protein
MSELLVYDLKPTAEQSTALKKTFTRFTHACDDVLAYADKRQQYNQRHLAAVLENDLAKKYQLPVGIAACACRRVAQDFVRLNPEAKRGQRREYKPDYYRNTWMLYSSDTASVMMKEAVEPWVTDYEYVVSLGAMTKWDEKHKKVVNQRFKMPFELARKPIPPDQGWHDHEIRLYHHGGKHWQLCVAVGVAEIAQADKPSPRGQVLDADYVPPEDMDE